MSNTSLIIKSTDPNGKTQNKTITNVNPDCSNEVLKTFGQKLNALTQNFYGETTRIDKTNCDLESGGGTLTPTFTFERTSFTQSEITAASNVFAIPFTYNGDGTVFFTNANCNRYAGLFLNSGKLCITGSEKTMAWEMSPIKIFATAGENYKATDVVTITITQ